MIDCPYALVAVQREGRSVSRRLRWLTPLLAWAVPNIAAMAHEPPPALPATISEPDPSETDSSTAIGDSLISGSHPDADAAEPQPSTAPVSGKPTFTVYSAVLSSYPVPNLGIMAYDGAVIQTGVTVALPNGLWFDVWNSTPLPRDGRWNLDNYGEEIDVTAGYGRRIGAFDASVSLAYFASQPLGKAADDIVELSPRLSLPIGIGKATLNPYLQTHYWLGIGHADRLFLRSGTSLTAPLSPVFSLSVDASVVHDLTNDHTVLRAEASLDFDLGNRWALSPTVKFSSGTRTAVGLALSKRI